MRASLLVALLSLPLLALADSTEPQLMTEGQRAFAAGDYSTAKDVFTQVLEMDSKNTLAIQFLRKIRLAEAGVAATPAEDPLQALIIPQIAFKDATIGSALDFLKQEAAKQSVTVSFVVQLPPDQAAGQHVTLNLTQVPFLTALHYLCQLAGLSYKQEPYAIVISPAGADASPAPMDASQAPAQ